MHHALGSHPTLSTHSASALDVMITAMCVVDASLADKLAFAHSLYDLSGTGGLSRDELTLLIMAVVVALARLFLPGARGLMADTGLKLDDRVLKSVEALSALAFGEVRVESAGVYKQCC